MVTQHLRSSWITQVSGYRIDSKIWRMLSRNRSQKYPNRRSRYPGQRSSDKKLFYFGCSSKKASRCQLLSYRAWFESRLLIWSHHGVHITSKLTFSMSDVASCVPLLTWTGIAWNWNNDKYPTGAIHTWSSGTIYDEWPVHLIVEGSYGNFPCISAIHLRRIRLEFMCRCTVPSHDSNEYTLAILVLFISVTRFIEYLNFYEPDRCKEHHYKCCKN